MRGVNGIGIIFRKRQTISHIQPQIDFVEWVGIDVHEAGEILGTAAKMKVQRTVRWADTVKVLARPMIGKSRLRDAPEHHVLVALAKQATSMRHKGTL